MKVIRHDAERKEVHCDSIQGARHALGEDRVVGDIVKEPKSANSAVHHVEGQAARSSLGTSRHALGNTNCLPNEDGKAAASTERQKSRELIRRINSRLS
jgi:hypothetical protein